MPEPSQRVGVPGKVPLCPGKEGPRSLAPCLAGKGRRPRGPRSGPRVRPRSMSPGSRFLSQNGTRFAKSQALYVSKELNRIATASALSAPPFPIVALFGPYPKTVGPAAQGTRPGPLAAVGRGNALCRQPGLFQKVKHRRPDFGRFCRFCRVLWFVISKTRHRPFAGPICIPGKFSPYALHRPQEGFPSKD